MNIQGWFPLGLIGFTSLQSKGLSTVFSSTTSQKYQFFCAQSSLWTNSQHLYLTTGKTIALTLRTFVSKGMYLPFNILFRFIITFLPRRKRLLISWPQSPSAVILEPKKIKPVTVSTFPPSICNKVMGMDAVILVFWVLNSKPAFSLSSHHEALK